MLIRAGWSFNSVAVVIRETIIREQAFASTWILYSHYIIVKPGGQSSGLTEELEGLDRIRGAASFDG
jgi:hypothetical protein